MNPYDVPSSSAFDIPLGITTALTEPASLKTCKGAGVRARVYLSDATRIWSWDSPLCMVVGLYRQAAETKVFHTIWELHFTLSQLERSRLFGSVRVEEVSAYHNGLLCRKDVSFDETRDWSNRVRAMLTPRLGVIRLDPKMDHGTQRRLQCSSLLRDLCDVAARADEFTRTTPYRGLALPFEVEGGPRARRTKAEREAARTVSR